MTLNNCAVILGDYVNGYAIVKELHDNGVKNIIVVTYNKKLAYFSKFVSKAYEISQSKISLLKVLKDINEDFSKLILYPTDDWFVDQITDIETEISSFCFIPFNTQNSKECSNKVVQYNFCEEFGIPYPKTISIKSENDFEKIDLLQFPLIIKPVIRNDLSVNVFRSKQYEMIDDFEKDNSNIKKLLDGGIEFLISEVIPGVSHGNIYAYSCYVDKEGTILNEWIGKKLSQYPDDYGVFSSASNHAPDIILEQGRTLVKGMGITGFCEPEFKFDYRDNKYKLMEVNLRSMMWNEVGRLSGVPLHYTQWQYANNLQVTSYAQLRDKPVILFYFKHEFLNLFFQKNYFKIFKSIWREPNLHWAACYKGDIKPIYKNLVLTIKTFFRTLIKK